MATRKKGGQRLMELARKSRKAKESRVGGKRYITPLPKPKSKAKSKGKTAVIKHGGTTITYKPKPSPHLKPATKKATKKAPPKSFVFAVRHDTDEVTPRNCF